MYAEPAPYLTSRLALFLSSSSLSLPLSPASLPSSPSPPSPSRRRRLHRSRLAYSSLMHHENSHVPHEVQRKKTNKKKGEKCMHEKGSRVTGTICLVVEKRRLDVGLIFSPHIRYEKHASLECRERKGRMLSLFDDVAIANRDYVERASTHISSRSLEQLFHHAQSNNRYSSHYSTQYE